MVTCLILLRRSVTDNTAEWLATSSCFVQWQTTLQNGYLPHLVVFSDIRNAECLPTSSCFVQWQRRPDLGSPSLCSEHPAQSWQNYESPSLRKEVPPLPRPLYSGNKIFSHDGQQFIPSPVFSLHTFFSLYTFCSLHSFLSLHLFFIFHFLQFAHFL